MENLTNERNDRRKASCGVILPYVAVAQSAALSPCIEHFKSIRSMFAMQLACTLAFGQHLLI
jgi:hypothetical protein